MRGPKPTLRPEHESVWQELDRRAKQFYDVIEAATETNRRAAREQGGTVSAEVLEDASVVTHIDQLRAAAARAEDGEDTPAIGLPPPRR